MSKWPDKFTASEPVWVVMYLTQKDHRDELYPGFRWPATHGYYKTEMEAIRACSFLNKQNLPLNNGGYIGMPNYWVTKTYLRIFDDTV